MSNTSKALSRRSGAAGTRSRRVHGLAAAGLVAVLLAAPAGAARSTSVSEGVSPRPEVRAASPGRLPLAFEMNRGQAGGEVRLVVRPRGMTAFLHDAGATFVSAATSRAPAGEDPGEAYARPDAQRDTLRMEILGARRAARARGVGRLPGVSNYFLGDDPARWLRGIPHHERAVTADVLEGVDLLWRDAGDGGLAYDLRLAPGTDAASVRIRLYGVGEPEIAEDGSLVVRGERGEWRQSRPVAYQVLDGVKADVACSFTVDGDVVSFDVGPRDISRPIVIDPEIRWVTYLGGSASATGGSGFPEIGRGIATDSSGKILVTGNTNSSDFPTQSAYQGTFGGSVDVFLSKLSADGSSLAYSTFIGGSANERGWGVALDSSGATYICGWTSSTNFPTASAFDSTHAGSEDVFVAKLSANGSTLIYSTYMGGSGADRAMDIVVDASGHAYVGGSTASTTGFPTQSAIQATHGGGADAFLSKLSTDGRSLSYSTLLGGGGSDAIRGIVVDAAGALYFGGTSDSTNFPTQSPEQQSNAGGTDGIAGKVNAAGSALVYATYLGGSGEDRVLAADIDSSGRLHVTGETSSTNFPTTTAAFQTTYGGGTWDGFVTKFAANGASHAYSTYLGGSGAASSTGFDERARCISIDSGGVAHVAGSTDSSDFPLQNAVQGTYGGGSTDAFVTAIAASGGSLVFSTFVGGSGTDRISAIVAVSGGNVHFVGRTHSTSGVATTGAYRTTAAGGGDLFVGTIGPSAAPDAPTDFTASVTSDVQIDLTWSDADARESSFRVQRATGGGAFADLAQLTANTESYSDSGVSGSTTYSYRVRAENAVGASAWSSVTSATTPPPPPSGVSGVPASSRSITLTWSDDTDDETAYVVERALGWPGVQFSIIAVLPANTTTYTDTTVEPETTYSYRVRTRGSAADSTPSLEVRVTSGPLAPSTLLALTLSDAEILLRWTDISAVEVAYEIEREGAGAGPAILATVAGNTAEYTDVSAAAESEYRYRVRAVGEIVSSPWSQRATARTAPAAPSDPFGAAVSASRVRLSWTDNSSVEEGFEVRRRLHGSELPFELVARTAANSTGYIDGGLLQETSYDYTVNSYDLVGDSRAIEIVDLETTAALVIRKVKLKAAKKKKPATMRVQADIDFGGYAPQAADGAAVGVNGVALVIDTVVAKKKGRVLVGTGEVVSFTLSRSSPTASRGILKITVSGDAAEVAGDAELTISFTTGSFTAAGSLRLSASRFDLKKHIGTRIDPDMLPTKLKLKLGGLEKDRLQLGASFEPRAVPAEQPNALITVGETRIIFNGAQAQRAGGKVTYRSTDAPRATLTVDYDKGLIKLKASGFELGDYARGDVPTLLDITIGALRWRDVPVLRSTGRSVGY